MQEKSRSSVASQDAARSLQSIQQPFATRFEDMHLMGPSGEYCVQILAKLCCCFVHIEHYNHAGITHCERNDFVAVRHARNATARTLVFAVISKRHIKI